MPRPMAHGRPVRSAYGVLECGNLVPPSMRDSVLLWQVLHDAKKIMALRLDQRRGSRGPLWQHPFWDRFVRHEREFSERLEYLPLNPVRKGLVKRPEDWRWSSYNNMLSIRPS